MSGFLWSGLGFWEWLLNVGAQSVVGFVVFVAILTPLVGRAKRFYSKQTDPFSPGGAGDKIAPDGKPMYEYLAKKRKPKRHEGSD